MKRFFAVFVKTFFFLETGFLLLAGWMVWRLNQQPGFLAAVFGGMLMSALIASAVLLFQRKKGRPVGNAVGGFLIVLPSVLVLRRVFGIAVFRFGFVIYLFAVLCAVIYGIAVLLVYRKVRKESADLNVLLAEKTSESQS